MKDLIRKTWDWALFAAMTLAVVMIVANTAHGATYGEKSGTLEWTVSVASGGIGFGTGMLLVGKAAHVRATTTAATVRLYGIRKIRNSAGGWTGITQRVPYGESGKYPSNTSIYWQLRASTLEVWNEFSQVGVDSLFVYNTGVSAENVTFQIILE